MRTVNLSIEPHLLLCTLNKVWREMRPEELLVCLQLAVVSLAGVASSCSGDLINCDPGDHPTDKCLCFQVENLGTGVTQTYRTCTSMTSLIYSSFNVREIEPGSFQHLDFLLSLNLSNNAPPELILHPRSFVGLTNLTFLDLQGDGLKGLPDCLFTPMTSLETLYLRGNNLTELNSQAFRNLSSLNTLYLDNNRLTELPPDLLEHLPALTSISLSSNMWNCSSDNIRTLVELVHSGLVVNGEELMCANSTLVRDIVIEGPTTPPSTSTPTPHPTLTPTVLPTSTTLHPNLTPTPIPQFCSAVENSGTVYGFLDWPETAVGESNTQECPHGPEGGVASRKCGEGGEWEEVEGSECNMASATTDTLIAITETDLSPLNIESISSSLSLALSSPSDPLTLDEVEVVLDITEQLLNFNGVSVMVLNNSLQAVDHLLSYSGDTVAEGGADIANRLRVLIDTALLSSLSTNNSKLVLMFSHLALGGIYVNRTDHTHILAIISMEDGATEVVIEEGGGSEEREGGSVEVEVDGELEGPVQVTVYNNTGLFNTSSCGSEVGVQGDIDLAPVISVSDEPFTNQETITITYHEVKVNEGDEVLCVRWNNSLNCGHGGWQTDGCQLREMTGSDIICVCEDNGTFAILDIHGSSVQSDGGTSGVVEYVFYACCVVAAILYLPVIMAVLLNRSLRVLPLKQCVANIAGSQALSLLVMAASYHPHSPQQLCYSLGVLQHYILLVALSWLAVYPIMAVLKVFRRMWFEHYWLLAPVAIVCWILPAVVVGAIGIPRYKGFTDDPHLCWLEADVFPTYFTFLSGIAMFLTLLLTILAVTILCCSDYDLEPPVHSRIVSNQLNAILYTGTIICHYITANSASHSHKYHLHTNYLLLITAIHVVLNAIYFLLAHGWGNSHIRSALLCREDPALKRKIASYQERTQTLSSVNSSRSSEHRNLRRNGTRINDEMNLNYVSSYLGYDEPPTSHVPLDMLGQVDQRRQGRRVKDRRSGELSGPIGPSGFQQVGFKIPHATSMT